MKKILGLLTIVTTLLAATSLADTPINSNQNYQGHFGYGFGAPSGSPVPATSPLLYGGHTPGSIASANGGGALIDLDCAPLGFVPQGNGTTTTCGLILPSSIGGTPNTVAGFSNGGVLGSLTLGQGLSLSTAGVLSASKASVDGINTGSVQLSSLASADFAAGTSVWVASVGDFFKLVPTTLSIPLVVVPASGKAGYAWERQGVGNLDWGAVTAWWVDPANTSTHANDENNGTSSSTPLATYGEFSRRIQNTCIATAGTTVTALSNGANTDPVVLSGVNFPAFCGATSPAITIIGTPIQIATGTMSAVTNPASASANSEYDFTDSGNTFTTWIQKYVVHRMSGTQVWAWPYSDRGSHVLQTSVPQTSTGVGSTWAVSDAYEVLELPTFADVLAGSTPSRVRVKLSLVDIIGTSALGSQVTNGVGLLSLTFDRTRLSSAFPSITGSSVGVASLTNVCLPNTTTGIALGGTLSIAGGLFAGPAGGVSFFESLRGPGSVSFSSVAPLTIAGSQFTLTNQMIGLGLQVMSYDSPNGGAASTDSVVVSEGSTLQLTAIGGARNVNPLVGAFDQSVVFAHSFANWNGSVTSAASPYVVDTNAYTQAQLGVDTNDRATTGSAIVNSNNLAGSLWSRGLSGFGTNPAVVELTDSGNGDHPILGLPNSSFMQIDSTGHVFGGQPPDVVAVTAGDVTPDVLANKLTATAPLQFTVSPGSPPLTGLQWWVNGSNVGISSGSNVATMTDLSGHGVTVTSAGGVAPTLVAGGSGINGFPVVRFTNTSGANRTNNCYLTGTINPAAWSGFSAAYVIRTAAGGSPNSPTIDQYDNTFDIGDQFHSVWWGFNAGLAVDGNAVGWVGPGGNLPLGTYSPALTNSKVMYQEYTYNKTTWTMSGQFVGTKADTSFPSGALPIYVGSATYPGSQGTDDLAEAFVWDHQLNSTETNALNGYIQAKYGIAIPGATGELTLNGSIQGAIVSGSTSTTAQNLGALGSSGLGRINIASGVATFSIASAGSDYQTPLVACTNYLSMSCVGGSSDLGGTNTNPIVTAAEAATLLRGDVLVQEVSTPSNPPSTQLACFGGTAPNNWECLNSSGTPTYSMQAWTCGPSTWMTASDPHGAFTCTQPQESDIPNLVFDLNSKVPTSRRVNTASPLDGGGALTSDLNLVEHGAVVTGGSSTTPVSLGASVGNAIAACVTTSGTCNPTGVVVAGGLNYDTSSGTETLANLTCPGNQFVSSATTSTGLGCRTLASGDVPCGALPAFGGDTFSGGGTCSLNVTSVESGASLKGNLVVTNTSTPGTAPTGKTTCWTDVTNKNLECINDVGTVNHGAQTQASSTGVALTGLSDDGSWTRQTFQTPLTGCSDYVSVTCQGGTSDIGGTNTNVRNLAFHDSSGARYPIDSLTAGGALAISGAGHVVTVSGGTSVPMYYGIINSSSIGVVSSPAWFFEGAGSTNSFSTSTPIEYAVGYAAGHVTMSVNFINNDISSGTLGLYVTRNGTKVGATEIFFGSGTPTGVYTATASVAGATSDTYGLAWDGSGGNVFFGASFTAFAINNRLTP